MKNAIKGICIIFGFICLALSVVGIVLPVLPSTPFLLVSVYCFAKGDEKVNKWFLSTNLYKKHIDCFVKERSMLLKTKIKILAVASLMLVGAFFALDNTYGRLFIVLLVIVKYYYFIYKIKTN